MTKGPGGTDTELVDIVTRIEQETEKAVLVYDDRGNKQWLPKSQIEYEKSGVHSHVYQITMPRWMAEEKNLS